MSNLFHFFKNTIQGFVILGLSLFVIGCFGPTHRIPIGSSQAIQAEKEKQLKMALEVQLNRQNRLQKISYPILTASPEQCGDELTFVYGFTLHHRSDYSEEYHPVLGSLNIQGEVTVRYVHPDSPAASAGVRAGDLLLTINDISMKGMNTEEVWEYISEFSKVDGSENSPFTQPSPLRVQVNRQGQTLGFTIPGTKACASSVLLTNSDAVNAFADGQSIFLTTGMLRFAKEDEELALVIGHELAHNTLGHVSMKRMNAIPGVVLDILIAGATGVYTNTFGNMASQVNSQGFEQEADYAGLYYTARAGYDIDEAAKFWRRMAIEHPASISNTYLSSHPSTPQRFTMIEETVKEINAKRRQGLAMTPILKEGQNTLGEGKTISEEES